MNKTIGYIRCFLVSTLLLAIGMTSCNRQNAQEVQTSTPLPHEITTELPIPTFTHTSSTELASQTSTATFNPPPIDQTQAVPTPIKPSNDGSIGTGFREETVDIIFKYQKCSGLIMSASSELAETYFPQLSGWIRVLGAPSLAVLQNKAERAKTNAVPYEGLAYGLETSKSTPEEEWTNLIESTRKAREIADEYGKKLVMGPGFQLMASNEDKYTPMASMADFWTIQTQQLQKNPPGLPYKEEIQRLINLIRADNPDIKIWAQITFPPNREPNIEEWLEYRNLIKDLVDGTYIGVYTWDTVSNDKLITAVDSIFKTVCGDIQ